MTDPRVWLITGATSGFGLALTRAALDRGDHVVGAARSPDRLAHLVAQHPLRLVLGADAIGSIRSRWERLSDELVHWEQVGRGTAH